MNSNFRVRDSGFRILLVGCGRMGGALLQRWQKKIARIEIIELNAAQPGWHRSLESLPQDFVPDVIVFAVKPQQMADILTAYRMRFGKSHPLYISIAAGKTLKFLASQLGAEAKIVRAMPNLPATLGKGMTVLAASPSLSSADKKTATQLMKAVGKVEWIKDESLMDAVTALSGSGPAYVFLFLEALMRAGIAAGLPEALAKTLALETVAGSCKLAAEASESLEQLRKNVTSPGGTTEAALKILMQGGALEALMKEAVRAARDRSKALAE